MLKKGILFCMAVCLAFSVMASPVYLHSDKSVVWKVTPQDDVANSAVIMSPGYDVSSWVDATVPGTVFASYVAAGLEEDPNFGDNIARVDRAKYDRSFWYRTEFTVPEDFDKELVWLNFNGVNRKADIYLNGKLLGTLDGFMHRGRFNVTGVVNRNDVNVLAVLVHIPQTPLAIMAVPPISVVEDGIGCPTSPVSIVVLPIRCIFPIQEMLRL